MKIMTTFTSLLILTISNLTACNDDSMKQAEVTQASAQAISINDDFSTQNPTWKAYEGQWQFNNGELLQSSTSDSFPVILREDKSFADVDIQVSFKPISGNIDASGGIVFRAKDKDNYYIVRANALENNYRLYTFVNGARHELASAKVTPPTLNNKHQMRVVAKGDHIQAYLDGALQIDYHDSTYKTGFTGLWTKADSVTAFDDFKISEVK